MYALHTTTTSAVIPPKILNINFCKENQQLHHTIDNKRCHGLVHENVASGYKVLFSHGLFYS